MTITQSDLLLSSDSQFLALSCLKPDIPCMCHMDRAFPRTKDRSVGGPLACSQRRFDKCIDDSGLWGPGLNHLVVVYDGDSNPGCETRKRNNCCTVCDLQRHSTSHHGNSAKDPSMSKNCYQCSCSTSFVDIVA